jgi:copper oxidase (laccase) domain-containing protein
MAKVKQWESHKDLLHGFIGRRDGKSIGPYAELNMSYRVGPSIDGCCYEIKEDVLGPLIDNWGELAKGNLNHSAKCFLKLRRLNRNIVEQAGIRATQIFEVGPYTSCASEDFFSYRRERKETGRQISFVGWHS